MQDVVERRAAENASAMKMVAEAASQAKTMQLACLCHEIRNPLNGILSSISFMEGTEMSSDQRDLLLATSACGKYLRRVVDNVLDLSKLEEGKLEVESEPFELIHVVDAVIAQEHENAGDKGLQVFCSVDSRCADAIVKGDKHRVQQIVANFFRNAVEYTERGWVEVQLYKGGNEAPCNEYSGKAGGYGDGGVLAGRLVHGQPTRQPTGQHRNLPGDPEEEMFPFVLCVADSGPGLSEEQQRNVFTGMDSSLDSGPALSRAASDAESRSSVPAGSGLGLIVSQKLASLMSGSVSCDSAPSQGSSFRLSLSLPFAGRSTHADSADAAADVAAGHASLAPGGMMSCYLSNRVKGVVYTSVGVWSSAEELAAAPVVPPSLSRSLTAPQPATAAGAAGANSVAGVTGRVQAGIGAPGAGLSGAGLSAAAAQVTSGMAGMALTGAHSHGRSAGGTAGGAAAVAPGAIPRGEPSRAVNGYSGDDARTSTAFGSSTAYYDDSLTSSAAAVSGSVHSAPRAAAGAAAGPSTNATASALPEVDGERAGRGGGGENIRVFSRLESHGSEEGSLHAAVEEAEVDAAALAAIAELEAAYGGRVMVQVLREVVDFREVAVLVEVGVTKEMADNMGMQNSDVTIVSTQQWGSALRLGPLADALRSATKAAVVAANRTLVAAQARGGGVHRQVVC
ncbi:hypothetical protein CLOM_g16476 [Closterium sp. NIES-68]|nr:hypothetical protein CLOM_g16476 [Closterium sp. NIES-68]GJP58197.1 hypothetical protein CLOP_g22668 [Closterium sp. NIES-67]